MINLQHTTWRGWAGASIVAVALFLWAFAPDSPSLIWVVVLTVSGITAGLVIIEATMNLHGRSLFDNTGVGGDDGGR